MSTGGQPHRERLGLPGLEEMRPGEFVAEVAPDQLRAVACRASASGMRLGTLFATDEGGAGRFAVHHVWVAADPSAFVRIVTRITGSDLRFPSIAPTHPAANWFEREIADYFGLVPEGHPNPFPVALHEDWPSGVWAMRKAFSDSQVVPRSPESLHPYRPVTGEGVFHVPVGPVHAGIIEPGHFRFGVAGEPVLYLQLRLFYTHKGIEKRFERLPWQQGLFLAESISGDTCVGHALAFAHAIERMTDIEVPRRGRYLRTVLLELERVYNHISDIGALANDVAFAVPACRAQTLREGLVSLQERIFGSRLLRGTVAFGGVKGEMTPARCKELLAHLAQVGREADELVTLLIDAGTFTDRVDGTGVLPTKAALDLGIVGMAARASGLDLDLRRDMPNDAYSELTFEVPVEAGGDVRARLMIRAREIAQSLALLRQALEGLPEGPVRATVPASLPAGTSALGWAEGWRGECLHYVETDAAGRLTRVRITDPSSKNWPGLALAVPGEILPDFPLVNKSFNLSYSGNDR